MRGYMFFGNLVFDDVRCTQQLVPRKGYKVATYINKNEAVPYHCSKFCKKFDASTKYSQEELQAGVECDNPKCCNPAHLKIGTHAENMLDMRLKGRARSCPGSSSKMAKLTETDVAQILGNKMSAADVMSLFKIGKSATYSILRRRTWKHVEVA